MSDKPTSMTEYLALSDKDKLRLVNDKPPKALEDEYVIERGIELARRFGGIGPSMLQRHVRIDYTQAARCIDIMQERGIIDAAQLVAPFGYKYIEPQNCPPCVPVEDAKGGNSGK